MDVLVGSTGFVGGHLSQAHHFSLSVHRPNVGELANRDVELLVCAGLPAEKWRANKNPRADWDNMAGLAQVLASVRAQRAVLISTIDVYQPALRVDETNAADFDASGAYGMHRAWFEAFFASRFDECTIVRLPGLFAPDLRKNLIHDLLHGREDQWRGMNPASRFQFFDARRTWEMVQWAWSQDVPLLNVSSEPITAQAIADLFGVRLAGDSPLAEYDMRSVHASAFGGTNGYLFNKAEILTAIAALRDLS
jgi:nucleoside-diphosphate-sugar epimerase